MHPNVICAWLSEVFEDQNTSSSQSITYSQEPPGKRCRTLAPIHVNMSGRSPSRRAKENGEDPTSKQPTGLTGQRTSIRTRSRGGGHSELRQTTTTAASLQPANLDSSTEKANRSRRTPSPRKRVLRPSTETSSVNRHGLERAPEQEVEEADQQEQRAEYDEGGVRDEQYSSLPASASSGDEVERTPRAKQHRLPSVTSSATPSRATAFFSAAMAAPSSRSFPSASVSSASSSKRSKSPVKNVDDLASLKPPVFWSISKTSAAVRRVIASTHPDTCHDTLALFDDIRRIANGQSPWIPGELRELLEQDEEGFEPQPDSAYISPTSSANQEGSGGGGRGSTDHAALYEMIELQDITSCTIDCQLLGRAEPAWNDLVHSRLLRLATRRCRRRTSHNAEANTVTVREENVTRATIAKPFIPAGTAGESSFSGKMIDYALVLDVNVGTSSESSLKRRLHEFLQNQPQGQAMFNQSTYVPLHYAPAGVFIETKTESGNRGEGRIQLGLWIAAWYKRVAAFLPAEVTMKQAIPTPPALPLILAEGAAWNLYFACNTPSQITIVGPLKIGSTDMLHDAFRVVTVLERLGRWVEEPYRRWVEKVIRK